MNVFNPTFICAQSACVYSMDGRFEGPQLTLRVDTIRGSKIPAEACDIWNSNV